MNGERPAIRWMRKKRNNYSFTIIIQAHRVVADSRRRYFIYLLTLFLVAGPGCSPKETVKKEESVPTPLIRKIPWSYIILYYENGNDRKVIEFYSNRTMNIIKAPGGRQAYTFPIESPELVGDVFELFRADSLCDFQGSGTTASRWIHITSCEMLLEGVKDCSLHYNDIRELPSYIRDIIQLINRYLNKTEWIL